MRKAHLYFLNIIFLVHCVGDDKINLPTSDFFTDLPKPGLTRNVVLSIRENKIYHNNSLVRDLNYFFDNIDNYVELNEGSNNFRLVIDAPKDLNFQIIDSLLHQARINNLLRVFLLTNNQKDSVGFHIPIPPYPITYFYPDYLKSDRIRYKLDLSESKILRKRSIINELCDSLINNNIPLVICPSESNNYSDVIWIYDKYYKTLYEKREKFAQNKFNKTLSQIDEHERELTNERFRKIINLELREIKK